MNLYKLNKKVDSKEILNSLGVYKDGVSIISDKFDTHKFFIKDLHVGAANILKQDALSIGAELAVPNGTITCDFKEVDCVLIANTKQLKLLAKKELSQPYGLKDVAKAIKMHIKTYNYKSKIMGIINANDDSFYNQSRFKGSKAIYKISQMIEDGADIIDIGGVSSRPNATSIDSIEELNRLKPILDEIKKEKIYNKVQLSIDSYTPNVIEYALESGFEIINDITGLKDDNVCQLASKYNATVVIMHMQGNPSNMQNNPHYNNVIVEIDDFFKQQIQKANSFNINNIILDVGIGFGKSMEHNLTLIKNLEHFKYFGYELLVGISRKSLIDNIYPTHIEDRLYGSLALHQASIDNGASIIRVHDVKEHFLSLQVLDALK